MLKYIFVLSFVCFDQCTPKKNRTCQTSRATGESKKRLSYLRSTDPRSLDPQAQFDEVSGMFISSVYDPLLVYHYLRRPSELQTIPPG